MSGHAYTEDQLLERPAIRLFAELGWTVAGPPPNAGVAGEQRDAGSRVGSLTADWERFFEWKRIEREDEPRRVSLETMIRGTCDRARLLDLVENFTLFSEHKAGLVKIIGQNHQVLGVNAAFRRLLRMRGINLDLRSPSPQPSPPGSTAI
jgi:hypothetical protein